MFKLGESEKYISTILHPVALLDRQKEFKVFRAHLRGTKRHDDLPKSAAQFGIQKI